MPNDDEIRKTYENDQSTLWCAKCEITSTPIPPTGPPFPLCEKCNGERELYSEAIKKRPEICTNAYQHRLSKLEKTFRKYLSFSSFQRFEINAAVALSARSLGQPLWLINVFSSGDAKSAFMDAIISPEYCYRLNKITSKTLVSGIERVPDLAPDLKNKVICIPDLAVLTSLPIYEKVQVWSQFRELYDGNAGLDAGSGKRKKYSDIHTALLANSTPTNFDDQLSIAINLGSRELVLRGDDEVSIKGDKLRAAWNAGGHELEMKSELNYETQQFLNTRTLYAGEISEDIYQQLAAWVTFIAYLRASAAVEQNGELRSDVAPEEPTRLIQQFRRLFICLKSLDKNYSDERALKAIYRVALGSCSRNRLKVLRYLAKQTPESEWNAFDVAGELEVGTKTAATELNILSNLGIVKRHTRLLTYPSGEQKPAYRFSLNSDHPVSKVAIKGLSYELHTVQELLH